MIMVAVDTVVMVTVSAGMAEVWAVVMARATSAMSPTKLEEREATVESSDLVSSFYCLFKSMVSSQMNSLLPP